MNFFLFFFFVKICLDGCEPNGHKCKKSCHNPIPCYKAQDTGYWHCYASAVEGQRVYDEKEAADTKGQMDEVQDEANDDTSNDVNDVADDSVRGRGKWVCGPGELCCPGGRGRGI